MRWFRIHFDDCCFVCEEKEEKILRLLDEEGHFMYISMYCGNYIVNCGIWSFIVLWRHESPMATKCFEMAKTDVISILQENIVLFSKNGFSGHFHREYIEMQWNHWFLEFICWMGQMSNVCLCERKGKETETVTKYTSIDHFDDVCHVISFNWMRNMKKIRM